MTEVPTSPQEPAGVPTAPGTPAGGASSTALASLILGILSVFFVFCCYFFSVPFGAAAILLGWLELKAIREGRSPPSNHGMAKTGLILGIVGLCLFALYIVFFILMLGLNIGLNPDFLRDLKIK